MNSTLKIVGLFFFLIILISLSTFGLLNEFSGKSGGLTKEEVQQIVKDTIRDNPELILSSVSNHQQKAQQDADEQARQNITAKIDEIEKDKTSPVIGNPDGDVTLVEFFDYNCGYCKKVFPYIMELVKEDSNLRVVFKELPILGPNSEIGSRAALAAHLIDPAKYIEMHKALMKIRIANKESVLKIAEEQGFKKDEFSTKMDSAEVTDIINKNHELANSLGIRGTPALVIGGEFIPGAIGHDEFKQKIAAARERKANN